MMKQCLTLMALAVLTAAQQWAAPILTLDPVNGIINGAPGTTVGWGFTLSNDVGFIVPSLIVFCEGAFDPSCTNTHGTFTDFAAQFQTNVVGTTVTQSFDDATRQGIGSFAINQNAPVGAQNVGTIFLVYDTFDCDITNPSCSPTQTGFSDLVAVSAQVNVTNVPEPSSFGIFATAALVLLSRFRRRLPLHFSRSASRSVREAASRKARLVLRYKLAAATESRSRNCIYLSRRDRIFTALKLLGREF
jgi:hypothetical protein